MLKKVLAKIGILDNSTEFVLTSVVLGFSGKLGLFVELTVKSKRIKITGYLSPNVT
ncbi:MAG: hypothetical protein FWG55_08740 [Candidatus Bathyarchaeota archaeon]|nr:hypothetical protein [Candidatus Termiticorpusculum sp.]